MAAAYLKCADALAEIRTSESDAIAARRTALEQQIFGIGSTDPMSAMDYRDALDTAEKSTQPKDALTKLARITRTKDETLAKAVASHAVEMGWSAVLDAYAADRPEVRDALAELRQIDSETADLTGQFARGVIYSPQKPPELQRFTNSMIKTMATANDDPSATAGVTASARSAQTFPGR